MGRAWRSPGWLRCESASAALEFGIVAPVLVLILVGVIEFGRLHWVRNSMEYAVEQTARWAIVNTAATDDQLKAHAKAQFDDVSAGKAKVEIEHDTTDGLNFMTVVVTYEFQFLADFAGIGKLSLRSETRVPLI
jgi:Flp pilus assembly protein TadG